MENYDIDIMLLLFYCQEINWMMIIMMLWDIWNVWLSMIQKFELRSQISSFSNEIDNKWIGEFFASNED